MSSGGGGGAGSGGGASGSGSMGNTGYEDAGRIDDSGLNPNRQRGFGDQVPTRFETPRLSDMRAKQGAIVARFLTFFQRKSSLVIELYNAAFYRQKPNWDRIADFVHNDLCNTAFLRRQVKDVQFHPVKMLIFIKCSEDKWRDVLVDRV